MARPRKQPVAQAQPQAQPEANGVKMRVIHPVLGMKVGHEFYGNLYDYRFQLKHKSIEVANA
jgi:hypothetical protein